MEHLDVAAKHKTFVHPTIAKEPYETNPQSHRSANFLDVYLRWEVSSDNLSEVLFSTWPHLLGRKSLSTGKFQRLTAGHELHSDLNLPNLKLPSKSNLKLLEDKS